MSRMDDLELDNQAVAARIRALITGQHTGDLTVVAERLKVSEISLRISVDALAPHPTLGVLLALVREYGVDPAWLLTGEYDPVTHRQAMDGDRQRVAEVLAGLAKRATPPQGTAAGRLAHQRGADLDEAGHPADPPSPHW